jgi:hypothetical protein
MSVECPRMTALVAGSYFLHDVLARFELPAKFAVAARPFVAFWNRRSGDPFRDYIQGTSNPFEIRSLKQRIAVTQGNLSEVDEKKEEKQGNCDEHRMMINRSQGDMSFETLTHKEKFDASCELNELLLICHNSLSGKSDTPRAVNNHHHNNGVIKDETKVRVLVPRPIPSIRRVK